MFLTNISLILPLPFLLLFQISISTITYNIFSHTYFSHFYIIISSLLRDKGLTKVATDNVIKTLSFLAHTPSWHNVKRGKLYIKALTQKNVLKYLSCLLLDSPLLLHILHPAKIVILVISVWWNVASNHQYAMNGSQWNHIWITGNLILTKLHTKLGIWAIRINEF